MYVCADHFHEDYLRSVVESAAHDPEADTDFCSFCDEYDEANGVPIEDIVALVDGAMRRHYERALDCGISWGDGVGWGLTTDTTDVMLDLGVGDAMDADVYDAVVSELEDDAWVPAGWPMRSGGERLGDAWRQFSDHVRRTSRFVLQPEPAPDPHEPDPDYSPADLMATIGSIVTGRFQLLTDIRAGTSLYRARTFVDEPHLTPAALVSPPAAVAGQGRMNAAGIPVFYGALDPDTAAAEVYDGNEHVVVATVEPLRDLTVVDLTELPVISVFDPTVPAAHLGHAAFLHGFVRDIVRPIVRDDRVHYEYAPTQYVTEWLRWQLRGPRPVDGIVYPSARSDGKNVVVFATAVDCLDDTQLAGGEPRPFGTRQVLRLVGDVQLRRYETPKSRALRTEPLVEPAQKGRRKLI